jgi:hypothetical protein
MESGAQYVDVCACTVYSNIKEQYIFAVNVVYIYSTKSSTMSQTLLHTGSITHVRLTESMNLVKR